jgi:hypothetical protein
MKRTRSLSMVILIVLLMGGLSSQSESVITAVNSTLMVSSFGRPGAAGSDLMAAPASARTGSLMEDVAALDVAALPLGPPRAGPPISLGLKERGWDRVGGAEEERTEGMGRLGGAGEGEAKRHAGATALGLVATDDLDALEVSELALLVRFSGGDHIYFAQISLAPRARSSSERALTVLDRGLKPPGPPRRFSR